jgi:hypothetical protein
MLLLQPLLTRPQSSGWEPEQVRDSGKGATRRGVCLFAVDVESVDVHDEEERSLLRVIRCLMSR